MAWPFVQLVSTVSWYRPMTAVGGEFTDSFILLLSCVTTAASQRSSCNSSTKGMITWVPFDTVGRGPEDVRGETRYIHVKGWRENYGLLLFITCPNRYTVTYIQYSSISIFFFHLRSPTTINATPTFLPCACFSKQKPDRKNPECTVLTRCVHIHAHTTHAHAHTACHDSIWSQRSCTIKSIFA